MISLQILRCRKLTTFFDGFMIMVLCMLISISFMTPASINAAEIHDAAKSGDLAKVRALIENNQALLDIKDEDGRTPLHWACRGVHKETVKYLVETGADVNVMDRLSVTPLHSTASRGHVDAAGILIEQGALLNVRMYDRATPLHLAARNGHEEMAALLLAKGALFNLQNDYEETALHIAASEGKPGVVKVISDWIAAKYPAALNQIDYDGWSALHGACVNGHLKSVELLASKGIDINLRNTVGQTAYNVAQEKGFQDIAAFLVQQGADQSPQKFPRLTGPYLGQEPPGKTPQLFAKGIVSTKAGIYGTIVFSPDNGEAFWKPNSEEMLFVKMENDEWSAPRVFPFKEKDSINVPFFSFDGRRLYFMAGSHSAEGMVKDESIWYVEKRGERWSEPQSFDPIVNSVSMHWQFSMDKIGNVYFSTDNIYCARFENRRYFAPEKLPSPINTVHTVKYRDGEIGPFISPEGDYLIYSKFPIGLYISFRNKDGSWAEPENLSEKLETKGQDSMAKLSPDGKYLFFQSVRPGSTPNRSLYWVDAGIIEEFRPKSKK